MNKSQVLETYDEAYARKYNGRFLHNDCQVRCDHEVDIIRQLLVPGGQWLDVGCGTGHILSHFPGVARAGLDLSPAMLERAKQTNPDALFFREGDFLNPAPEWSARWALVTCMWYAYTLVESMAEIECLIRNLATWTAPGGTCFIPICSPELLASGVRLPYTTAQEFHGGELRITGVTWTYVDEDGVRHDNLVAPQVDHMVALASGSFDDVAVIQYPLYRRGEKPFRKAIVAKRGT